VGLLAYVAFIQYHYPLQDVALVDFNWMREWLYVAVIDRMGFAVCLAFVVYINEPPLTFLLFSAGLFAVGSPFACLYLVYR
jgi:hypothetical protein